jgi:hypothetical protein
MTRLALSRTANVANGESLMHEFQVVHHSTLHRLASMHEAAMRDRSGCVVEPFADDLR